MNVHRIRQRTTAMILSLIATAVLIPLAAQTQAHAAPPAPDATVGPAAWTPQIYPLFSGEWVRRNVASADRNAELVACSLARGIACVSVGQGDGRHSVFHLFKCDTRSLSNFINALAVRNHQTNNAKVHFWGPRYSVLVPADTTIHTIPDYATYEFNRLDLC
ncbi:hypothetical protein [Kribbella sp. NPDC048915]|uniref:hypothetical protein n=1 Tax=Kribbella sp. NPDC048915 TaxID=3155148 RepID=UPI0033FBD5AC